ncbi:MAG: ABC transporter ATP-binding protein [Chloroflexi bacterium]|nr:ABC transporter ATP-binding protein [Chloroflexota bacterium]
MSDTALSTHDLSVGYTHPRRSPAVVSEKISLSLRADELVCLIGPNGAGKSTLMRTLAGMQPALRGQVLLGGDDVFGLNARDLARRLSIVLTERVDVGNLSAYGLVALGRHPYTDWTGNLSPRDERAVRWAIETVGARHLAARPVSELSDGERQKIMIARALAQEPLVMLLDEPTAFLDLPNRVEVMRVLRHLSRTTGRAILLSTHDLDLALRSADTIWLMSREGVLQVGAPEDLVLSGAFEATFRSEGVIFDQHSGAFKILTPETGTVGLVGDGLVAHWTRRALEREGFRIHSGDSASQRHVEVMTQNGQPHWRMVSQHETHEHDSLYSLIRSLRQEDEA